ncbi:MAG: hypothetical protein JJV97_04980 [SAR324 cluster bacterium]|nr:hypothetical protein [SAR324 cluster bacterium]
MNKKAVIDHYWVDFLKQGEKSSKKIGVEWEVIGFEKNSLKRLSYAQISQQITEFVKKGWQPLYEGKNIIGATLSGESLSIEPGGQLEYSSAPCAQLCYIKERLYFFQQEIEIFAKKQGWIWISVGIDPFSDVDNIPLIPKFRYKMMSEYLKKYGSHASDMMRKSASLQISFDYASEQDMRQKFLVAQYLTPIGIALFSSSGLNERQISSFNCHRAFAWMELDPVRTGLLKRVFNDNFSYYDYVKFALSVPMLSLIREGVVQDFTGGDFAEFWRNGSDKIKPEKEDWLEHLRAIFTFIRLKNVMELRIADATSSKINLAQISFFLGLLYHQPNLEKLAQKALSLGFDNINGLTKAAINNGLQGSFNQFSINELAQEALNMAKKGIKQLEPTASNFLDPLDQLIATGDNLSTQISNLYKSTASPSKERILEILTKFELVFC